MKFLKPALCLTALLFGFATSSLVSAQSNAAIDPGKRLDQDIKFLASDEVEGREPGTPGIELAADYIIDTWKEYGVKSGTGDGTYRQKFNVNMGTILDRENSKLVMTAADGEAITLAVGDQFNPIMIGGKGSISDVEMAFVGYGITAEEHNYNDFADIDVDGKVVVMLRMEPQQKDPNSVFEGTDNSPHASIQAKINLAKEAGAIAVLFVNDGVRATDDESDELAQPSQFGQLGRRSRDSIPFFHVKRSAINKIFAKTPAASATGDKLTSLGDIESLIDEKLEPVSQAIAGWKVDAASAFTDSSVETSNIVGIIEGEGPNADETVLIGGHYDHLGFGGYGSNAPGRREIHNGADDNATGTAGVIELARRFAMSDKKPGRRLVFVAFSGEERGLLGSAYYVENPLFDLRKTVAMINYDMIGRLRDDKLTIFGTATGDTFDALLDAANNDDNPLALQKTPSPFAGSDHMAFVRREIPVMFLHTGLTDIYHTPEDDYDTLNIPGAIRVVDYTERLISELANAEQAPQYKEFSRGGSRPRRRPAYLGVRLDYDADERGPKIAEAPEDDSPAGEAGLKLNDVILSMDGEAISDREELTEFLTSQRPNSEIEVKIVRDDEEQTIEVTLGRAPRARRSEGNSEEKSGENSKG